VFEKYPHLARLQYEELNEESTLNEDGSTRKKLLLD